MDTADLCGHLRGLCLIVAVRVTGRALDRPAIETVLRHTFAEDIKSLVTALSSFTTLEEAALRGPVDELLHADEEYLHPDNINLQLGLLSGRAVPIFPFIQESGVDSVALRRPFMETARNLVHASVRVRMQAQLPLGDHFAFWREGARFLRRVGGDDDLASAMALSTVANVISDVIFFNSDAPTRTGDRVLAKSISHVLEELRAVNIVLLLR